MDNQKQIKIVKNGPYLVSGSIPLKEYIIKETKDGNVYQSGRVFPLKHQYALCRCGKSKMMPYCDGTHQKCNFNGEETASFEPYLSQAEKIEGPELILTDVEALCAFTRFCHGQDTDVWTAVEKANDEEAKTLAVKLACECPAGRLVIWNKKDMQVIEPVFEKSIILLQDPARHCSGPLWIRGGIPIISSTGRSYEIRNRVTLCRCGVSTNKPFCDANHINHKFSDKLKRDLL